MEKQSFKDTLITDTKFYDPNTSCGKYVKRKKITLEDLLGENYEKIHKKSQSHTRRQLETLVTMLRHIYLGESLPKINIEQLDYYLSFEHMLDRNDITYNSIDNLNSCNYKKDFYHACTPWGFIIAYNKEIEYIHLTDYFVCSTNDIETLFSIFYKEEVYDKRIELDHRIKLIDFFKWEKLKEEKYLYPYAKAYIDAYNSVFKDIENERNYDLRMKEIAKYEDIYKDLIDKLSNTEDILINLYKQVGLLPKDSSEDIDIKEMIKNRHN